MCEFGAGGNSKEILHNQDGFSDRGVGGYAVQLFMNAHSKSCTEFDARHPTKLSESRYKVKDSYHVFE